MGYWRWSQDVPEFHLERIKLPPGFTIRLCASDVPGARSMALGAGGTLFVGTRDAGKVYALVDRNHNNRADEVITIASGLNVPNGVAFRDGALYVAGDLPNQLRGEVNVRMARRTALAHPSARFLGVRDSFCRR